MVVVVVIVLVVVVVVVVVAVVVAVLTVVVSNTRTLKYTKIHVLTEITQGWPLVIPQSQKSFYATITWKHAKSTAIMLARLHLQDSRLQTFH